MLKNTVTNLFKNIIIASSIIHTIHKIFHVVIITTVALVANSAEQSFINLALYLLFFSIGSSFFPSIVSNYGYKSAFSYVLLFAQIMLLFTLFTEIMYTSVFYVSIGILNGCLGHIKYYMLGKCEKHNKSKNINILIFLSIVSISFGSLVKMVPGHLMLGIIISMCLFFTLIISMIVNHFENDKEFKKDFKYDIKLVNPVDAKFEYLYIFSSLNTIVMMVFMILMMKIAMTFSLSNHEISSLMLLHMIAMFIPSLVLSSLYKIIKPYILMTVSTIILLISLIAMLFVEIYYLFLFVSVFVGIVWNINYATSILTFEKNNNSNNSLGKQGKFEFCISLGVFFSILLNFVNIPTNGLLTFISILCLIMLLITIFLKKEII